MNSKYFHLFFNIELLKCDCCVTWQWVLMKENVSCTVASYSNCLVTSVKVDVIPYPWQM